MSRLQFSDKPPAAQRAAGITHRFGRAAGRAAWLGGLAGLLLLALALGTRAPTAMAAPLAPAGSGTGPSTSGTQETIFGSSAVNLRNGPGLDCQMLTTIPGGATVIVISGPAQSDDADGHQWYHVTYADHNGHDWDGYVAGDYLSGQPSGGNGASLTAGGYASVTALYLNMRCGPSTVCPVSMSLPQGTVVKLLDDAGDHDNHHWWHVSYNNLDGYVAGEYLEPASGPGPAPQSCTTSCGFGNGDNAVVTSDTLNLRTGPSTLCPVITVMPHGATVEILSGPTQQDGHTWYKVSYNGVVGYAAGDYLKATGNNGCQSYCGSVHVGQDAYVRDTPSLNLRNGAGMSCDIETSMPEGAKVHVMDGPTHIDDYDWYHVTYTDQDGHDWDGYAADDWLGTTS